MESYESTVGVDGDALPATCVASPRRLRRVVRGPRTLRGQGVAGCGWEATAMARRSSISVSGCIFGRWVPRWAIRLPGKDGRDSGAVGKGVSREGEAVDRRCDCWDRWGDGGVELTS